MHTSHYIAIPLEKGGDERLTLYVYLNRQRNLVRGPEYKHILTSSFQCHTGKIQDHQASSKGT